jgi:hypothetical protein
MGAVLELKKSTVDPSFIEKVAHFAHDGLPYMKSDDNWIDFDKAWVVNVWWDNTESTYRATMYKKHGVNHEPDLRTGVDLF